MMKPKSSKNFQRRLSILLVITIAFISSAIGGVEVFAEQSGEVLIVGGTEFSKSPIPTADTFIPVPNSTDASKASVVQTAEPSPISSESPSREPEASSEPKPSASPATTHIVTILAPEDVTAITITDINDETNSIILLRDESDSSFKGSAKDGLYKLSATAKEGRELDLKNSSLTILVDGEDSVGAVATVESGGIGSVESIEVHKPPARRTYKEGETFDPAGLEILVKYNEKNTETKIIKYGDDTAKDFAFVPILNTTLPNANPYDTGRTIAVIYGNRSADVVLDFILCSAEAHVTAPGVKTIASTEVNVPRNACYTPSGAVWSPAVYPGSNFNYGTEYSVEIEFTAKEGFIFDNEEGAPIVATVNNKAAEIECISENGKKLKVKYIFPVTHLSGEGWGGSNFSTAEGTPGPTTKPALNTYDHFAYIVGYPDGNIRPENNITRDEVSTIFFRLLTDDTRSIYWTKVNHYLDVPKNLWSNNAISTLTNAGILSGDGTAYFRPSDYITRGEFAAIAAGFSDAVSNDTGKFGDVNGHWSEKYVDVAAQEGWIRGYEDGTFRPDQNITRAEAMTIINNVLERKVYAGDMISSMTTWPDNNDTSEWYYATVQEATNTHNYHRPSGTEYETWTEIGDNPDWIKLEQQWSSAGSAGSIN